MRPFGDSRDNSVDSRHWDNVPVDLMGETQIFVPVFKSNRHSLESNQSRSRLNGRELDK
jgi:hypothetical protein